MACTLSNKCAKNLSKRTVLLQLIIINVVTCFFWNTVYILHSVYFVSRAQCIQPQQSTHHHRLVSGILLIPRLQGCSSQSVTRYLLSRVSTLTRDIDIANLSVCLSVRYVPVLDKNGLAYRHRFCFTIR